MVRVRSWKRYSVCEGEEVHRHGHQREKDRDVEDTETSHGDVLNPMFNSVSI